jgi:hypothetical protein
MPNAVTSLSHVDPPAATAIQPEPRSATATQKLPQSQSPAAIKAPADSVHISSAAQAALQEALETQTQTRKEAANGDPQANRLLIRQAAAQKVQP